MIEGIFTKAFRTGLQPVELANRILREMDANKTITATFSMPGTYKGGSVTNTATISSTTTDNTSSNNSASVTSTFSCPALVFTPSPLRVFRTLVEKV